MAVQSSFKNMVLCLFVICLVCSSLLAGVNALTFDSIAKVQADKINNTIAKVVPEFDGAPVLDTVAVDGKEYSYYTVSRDGAVVAYAINASASGFGGAIQLMVGVTADRLIYNTSVLSQAETPGLGAKCTEPAFAEQFKGFDPAVKVLKVRKDRGDIDAITASTITSRAYCEAVKNALAAFDAIKAAVPCTACPSDSCNACKSNE